ncbi:hypothetical protein GCM10009647_055930 [Streptomyces sanglieri]
MADASARGTAGDLVLAMYGRIPVDSLKPDGDRRLFDQLLARDPDAQGLAGRRSRRPAPARTNRSPASHNDWLGAPRMGRWTPTRCDRSSGRPSSDSSSTRPTSWA